LTYMTFSPIEYIQSTNSKWNFLYLLQVKELACQNVDKLNQRQENLEELSDRSRMFLYIIPHTILML